LPTGAKLHDVFHVGLLKQYHSEDPVGPGSLPTIRHGHACLEPVAVVKSRLPRGRHEVLVQWIGISTTNASWVDLAEFHRLYPTFQPKDELVIGGGRDVMWGLTYNRR
jgi:hypothetical protein